MEPLWVFSDTLALVENGKLELKDVSFHAIISPL